MQLRFILHSLDSFTHLNQKAMSYHKLHSLLEVCDPDAQVAHHYCIIQWDIHYSTYRSTANFISDKNSTRTCTIWILPH